MIRMKDFPGNFSQATSRSLVQSISSHGHRNTTIEIEQSESIACGILYIREVGTC